MKYKIDKKKQSLKPPTKNIKKEEGVNITNL